MATSSSLDKIEHIIVLMMENRSFDNVLGWLYDPESPPPFNQMPPRGQSFEGLYGKNLSNPDGKGNVIPVSRGTVTTNPNPDPGEVYQNVYCQVYNVEAVPPANQPFQGALCLL